MKSRNAIVGAAAELRHLYKQMLHPSWSDEKVASAARGLLGPAIASIERALEEVSKTSARLAGAADGGPDEEARGSKGPDVAVR